MPALTLCHARFDVVSCPPEPVLSAVEVSGHLLLYDVFYCKLVIVACFFIYFM